MTENNGEVHSNSRRSAVTKGVLAATAAAVGAGATAGTGAAQENEEAVVFGEDYVPDANFDVAGEADEGTKNEVFESAGLTDEFDDPDDWDLYLISYDASGSARRLGLLMVEEQDLSIDDSGTMDGEGSVRNPELNLIEFDL